MPTEAQRIAVESAGNTLVMAGAGTGKTTTLVNRVLHWITAGGHSIERLLLVTFTEAAAAEMRQRLRNALTERIADASRETVDRLHEQVALLEQARISTLHSFCLNLIREHFHLLGIDPDLRVLDERQTRPLEERVLDELFAEHYAGRHGHSTAVQRLVRVNGNGSERAVRGQVLAVYRFARTLDDPGGWLARETAKCDSGDPTDWNHWLEAELVRWRGEWRERLGPLAKVNDWAALTLERVEATGRPTDDRAAVFGAICKPGKRWASRIDPALKDAVERCWAEAGEFASLLEIRAGRTGVARDWDACRGGLAALLALVTEFDARFTRAKRELGGIDFADQEQLALALLRDETNGVAAGCREFYQQVMIDEAQDINRAQDAILRAVSGENRFVVGDVKQCIYQFRLTDPEIFQTQARRWREEGSGRVVPLRDNFRSHEGVVDFVNELFTDLMVPEVGGMAYDEDARLCFGAPDQRQLLRNAEEGAERRVEINFLATQRSAETAALDEDRAELLAVEQEARLVAGRLRDLRMEEVPVWDASKEAFRPVEWRDMVVLLRSPGPCAEAYVREFRRSGVPLLAKRAGFYSAIEVRDLLNLLTVLDNPVQDLPLLAVLRSPLVGLSANELGWLRVERRKEPVWRSVKRYAEAGEDAPLRGRVADFLARYADWRALSRQSSLSHCLEVVLEQTHYESLLAMTERGVERVGNVRRFLDLARQFDPWQRQGLHRFVRFVAAQQDADLDLEPAPPSAGNAVTLMSIHQSKGLEFPVVVTAGLGRQFNEGDVNAGLVVDEEFGLCPQVYPAGPERRFPSLPLTLARRRRRIGLRAEEGRLLYVACTRARDRLFLVGTVNATIEKVCERMVVPLDVASIGGAKCMLDWVLRWIGKRSGSRDLIAGAGRTATAEWRLMDETPAGGSGEIESSVTDKIETPDPDALADRLEFAYPFAGATIEAAKTSVSELRRRSREADDAATTRFQSRTRFRLETSGSSGVSAAGRGTAHHAFLQLIDFEKAGSPQELRSQANQMVERGALTAADCAVIDFERVAEFFLTPLGKRVRGAEDPIERELPFTVRLRSGELAALGVTVEAREMTDEDFVVVQGVVDLAVIGNDAIEIVDYKTDAVAVGEVEARALEYAPQLKLYALALERIYGRRVSGAWLHFLQAQKSVNVLAA